jgi:hypothetical protein
MEPVSDTSQTHRELTALKEEESGGGERTKAMRRPSKLQTTLFGAPGGEGREWAVSWGIAGIKEGGGGVPSLKL